MPMNRLALVTALMALGLTGCGSSSEEKVLITASKPINNTAAAAQDIRPNQSGFSSADGTLAEKPQAVAGTGKKLLAIYMVGSDLESRGDAGTSDLNEMIEGYNQLSETQRGELDVVVAFGGSLKEGWQGVRFAHMGQIIEDGKNQQYGDNGDYLYQALDAHMGDETTLKLFLDYLKEGYENHEQKFLIMWDHGSAYGSFGNDEHFNGDGLTMVETDNALSGTALKFDMIGYDACLNGNFEIASMVQKHADYLIGSEELEPGHGWSYNNLLPSFSQNSNLETFGTELVNNFVTNEGVHPYAADGKTLSMVNLRYYDELKQAVDGLADYINTNMSVSALDMSSAVINATNSTEQFGKHNRDSADVGMTIDLKAFAESIQAQDSNAYTGPVLSALGSYVVHSNQDGSRPNSHGVSIVPPMGYDSFYETFTSIDLAPSQSWYQLTQTMQGIKTSDTTRPEVSVVGNSISSNDLIGTLQKPNGGGNSSPFPPIFNFYTTEANQPHYAPTEPMAISSVEPIATTTIEPITVTTMEPITATTIEPITTTIPSSTQKQGLLATFSDAHLSSVKTIYGNIITDEAGIDWFSTVAVLPAAKTNQPNQYFAPEWNQKWYYLQYNSSDSAWLPLEFENQYTEGGHAYATYSAEAEFIQAGKDYSKTYPADEPYDYARFYLTIDQATNQVVRHAVRPYKMVYSSAEDTDGTILYDKMDRQLQKGDQITFLAEYYNLSSESGESEWFYESEWLTIETEPKFSFDDLTFVDEAENDLKYYYFMLGSDMSGNWSATELREAVAVTTTP